MLVRWEFGKVMDGWIDGWASVLEVVEFPVVAFFDVEDSAFFVWEGLI
jgi:hypothetical protein